MNDYIQRTILCPDGRAYEVRASFEYITPKIAEEYLKKNMPNNRDRDRKVLNSYKRDMSFNEWWFTGDTIKFNNRGLLCDGQNRLKGVAETGKSQTFLVIRGIPDPAVVMMDSGKMRTLKDALTIEQNDTPLNNNAMIALVKAVIGYGIGWGRNRVTKTEQIRVFERYCNEFITIKRIAPKMKSAAQAALFTALLNGVNQTTLAEYVNVFMTRNPSLKYNDDAALKWEQHIHNIEKNRGRVAYQDLFFGFQNSVYFFATGKRYQMPKKWVNRYPIKDEIASLLGKFAGTYDRETAV